MTDIPPKIADGLPNAKDVLGDRLASAYTEDGKLWFVSRKGVEQPSISFYHETPLQGGNLVFFDVHAKKWSEPTSFPSISNEELLEATIFGYKNRLLLLTYQKWGESAFRDLYEWKDQEWRKVDLEANEKTKFECNGRAEMKRAVDASGNAYFVAEHGFGLNVYKLQLSEDGKKATIKLQRDVSSAFPPNAQGAHLVRTAASGSHLYAIYGQEGCGFHWNPTRPFRIDLRDGSVEHLEVGGESRPPWSFSGAYADRFTPPSSWLFFGGSRARGVSHCETDPSIWILDLEKKEWKQFEAFSLPEGAHFVGAFGDDEGKTVKFYVVNVNSGVYEIDPSKC